MCTERQHDAENIRLRHEVAQLKESLRVAQEKLHTRNTSCDWLAWRATYQSDAQAAMSAFNALVEARKEIEHLKKMIDHGIA